MPRARSAPALIFTLLALLVCACRARSAPPVLSTLPPFTLTSERGEPFGLSNLRGHVWVANFIFTRCPSICPTFTAQMASLEKQSIERALPVRFVSFSVDPAHDTPEVLAAYAKEHGADPTRWTFLTGSVEQIQDAVVKGLKIAAKPIGPDDDLASVFHGSHFVLIDASARIRGYYDSSDPARVDAILRDAATL